MFTKGRFWEDERRKKRRSSEEEGVAKQHDAFEMSEVDLDSMRTSRIATSFAASSSQRASGIISTTSEGSLEGGAMTSREGELHEMGVVVVPQQIVVVPHE